MIVKKILKIQWKQKRKKLIVFDDMIVDMLSNKNLNPIVTEWFLRGRKLNIHFVFILLFQKKAKFNTFFVIKIRNKRYL